MISRETASLVIQARRSRCAQHPHVQLRVATHEKVPAIVCSACGGPVREFIEAETVSGTIRRGGQVPAAFTTHVKGEHSMTDEQRIAVAAVRTAPPSKLPTAQEAAEIMKVFAGWDDNTVGKDGKPRQIAQSTAVALYGLVNMGFLPHQINLLGGKPYINVDGRISHAQAVMEARGEKWGRIVYREATHDERVVAGAREGSKPDLCLVATYQERQPIQVRRKLPDGSVESFTRNEWVDGQSEYGRANAADTVVKARGKGSVSEQPVERQFPAEMARVRALSKLLRLMTGTRLPTGVGTIGLEGVAVDVDESENLAMLAAPDEPPGDPPEDDGMDPFIPDEEDEAPAMEVEAKIVEENEQAELGVVRELGELDLSNPGGDPRTTDEELQLTYETLATLVKGDAEVRNIDLYSFKWEEMKGKKAAMLMLTEGWSPAQVIGVVKAQAEARD